MRILYPRIVIESFSLDFINCSSLGSSTLCAVGVRGTSFVLVLLILALEAVSYRFNKD